MRKKTMFLGKNFVAAREYSIVKNSDKTE